MPRTFGPSVLPKDMNRWTYEAIRRLELGHASSQTIISAILRGEGDGGGPIIDTSDLFKLGGRPQDQDAHGSVRSGGNLTLSSTVHAVKGLIYLGDAQSSAYDETNDLLGIATATPDARLHVFTPIGTTQSAVPTTGGAGNVDWGAVGGTFTAILSDLNDATYARWDPNTGFASTLQGNFTAGLTDPGVGGTVTVKLTARANTNSTNSRMNCIFSQGGGAQWLNIFVAGPAHSSGGQVDAVLTPSFAVYSFSGSLPTMNFSAQPFTWAIAFSGIGGGTGFFDFSRIEVVLTTAIATVTLMKWESPSSSDQLDFTLDGASGFDMSLTGDTPLRVETGDGTSGLRFVTSSSTSRIEVGTAAGSAMDLIFSGTRNAVASSIRAATNGLMISDVVAGSISAPSALLHLKSVASVSTILFKLQRKASQTGDLTEWLDSDGTTKLAYVDKDGKFTVPSLLLGAGTTTVSPLQFQSGTSLTTPLAGVIEFTTDDLFFTITTGPARKAFILDDGARLISGRVPFATTNGRLIDDADMTFATDTLTVTKLIGTTSIKVGTVAGYLSSDGSAGATGSFTTVDLKTVTVKDGIITSIV